MRYFSAFLSGILVLLSLSCKKGVQDIKTKIEGRITDYYTGNPINNATVKLFTINSNINNQLHDTIETTYTDSDGQYSITFHARREADIYYGISINKISQGYHDSWFDIITKKHDNHHDFSLRGESFLKIHFKNASPFNNDDNLWFGSDAGLWGYHGAVLDTIVLQTHRIYVKQPDGAIYWQLYWRITKNHIENEYRDSLYGPYQDTARYEIFY